jgi:SAM-dependent methyltransferase
MAPDVGLLRTDSIHWMSSLVAASRSGKAGLMPEADLEEFDAALGALGDRVPDSVEYQRLGELSLRHPLAARLRELDPFSAAYKTTVLQLYHDLRGDDRTYEPARDEKSGMVLPANLWSGASPWSFGDTGLVAEFLLSWGQIMRALALPPSSDAKILEYGSGSGQLLLFLARLGLRTSAVDIDPASLELVRTQAAAMQLEVRTEQAAFGDGFGDEAFDRIIFFEAFHHAIEFGPLLLRLRQRLKPGGLLVLSGEPVVGEPVPSVPYPWGPRLDGLSIFCIRRYGWMELGFTESFLIEALHRHGWLVDVLALPGCGRATTYVAKPYIGQAIEVGRQLSLGPHDAGWEGLEGTHRWTRGGATTTFPLPDQAGPSRVAIRASNPFPTDLVVALYDGVRYVQDTVVAAGGDNVEIVFGPCYCGFFGMKSAGSRPIDVWPQSADRRRLGLMVHSIRVDAHGTDTSAGHAQAPDQEGDGGASCRS